MNHVFNFEVRPAIAGAIEARAVISGDLEGTAKYLAQYADGQLQIKQNPAIAAFIIMAYHEFKRLNPAMTEGAEIALGGAPQSGAIIKMLKR